MQPIKPKVTLIKKNNPIAPTHPISKLHPEASKTLHQLQQQYVEASDQKQQELKSLKLESRRLLRQVHKTCPEIHAELQNLRAKLKQQRESLEQLQSEIKTQSNALRETVPDVYQRLDQIREQSKCLQKELQYDLNVADFLK